jgi:hypothetical protein
MGAEQTHTKAARNQALFRDVNERVNEISEGGVPDGELIGFICECADAECFRTIELTRDEYAEARRIPTRFPIAVGHEWSEVERVVERCERYEVVEKFGESGKIAVRTARAPG